MKVGILQSNYIPWRGYFDLISQVDLFVFHDDLQYTKSDWRNRNLIKTQTGLEWLTIPCGQSTNRLICNVSIADAKWQKKHFDKLVTSYSSAPFFKDYYQFLREIYLGQEWRNLSVLNQHLIQEISKNYLRIETKFLDSRDFKLQNRSQERVLELLGKLDATEYLSGPAGKNYLTEDAFEQRGIRLNWMDYSGYQKYEQLYPPFEQTVTILDLLFHLGDEAAGLFGKRH